MTAARKRDFGIVDVVDHGADPTGTVDSAAAINRAIQASLGPGGPGAGLLKAKSSVFIPGGEYRIDSRIEGVADGLSIFGEGWATRIASNFSSSGGGDQEALFYGGGFVRISGLQFKQQSGDLNAVVRQVSLGETGHRTLAVDVNDIYIHETRTVDGFVIEGQDANDGCTYRNLYVSGVPDAGTDGTYWINGVRVGNNFGGNNLDHDFFGLNVYRWENGFLFDGSNGSVNGGQIQANLVDIRRGTPHGQRLEISNIRSENSERFFVAGNTTSPGSITSLRDIDFQGSKIAADGEFIRCGNRMLMESINVRSRTVLPSVKASAGGGTDPIMCTSINCQSDSAVGAFHKVGAAAGGQWQVIGYAQTVNGNLGGATMTPLATI